MKILPTFAAAGLISAALAAAPPAHASGWQSIYAGTDGRWGASAHYGTKADAEASALRDCRDTGTSNCEHAATSMECVALVYNGTKWSGGYGSDTESAINVARIENGGNGDVLVTRC